ncbi:MAG: hypothetical protein AAFN93_03340 [Bacteroidota bacterium]
MVTEEEKNKRKGMIIAAGSHALLFILFLFLLAWKAPDPPNPEYGIEVNFGLDNVGTGEVQPETPVNETTSEEEAAPEELPEEVVEEEVVEESEPVEEVSEPVQEQVVETPVTAQESPDVVPEVKEEPKKPEPKPEEKKEEVVEKPKEQEKKETVKPSDGANGKDGESNEQESANQGDNADEVGDKGEEQGTLDSRALYGRAGGGDGSALEMTGWNWDFRPDPKDNSSENGKIVFEVKIDDQGEILQIRQLESNVSPSVAKVYKEEVQKLTFSRTDFNSIVPPTSTGRITFVIRSK